MQTKNPKPKCHCNHRADTLEFSAMHLICYKIMLEVVAFGKVKKQNPNLLQYIISISRNMKFQIWTGKWSSWLNPRNALKKQKMCSKEVFDPRNHLDQSWVMTTNQKGRISIWTFVGRNLDRALSDHTRSHQHLNDWSMLEHKFVLDLRLTVNWVQKISAAIFFCIWPDQICNYLQHWVIQRVWQLFSATWLQRAFWSLAILVCH